MFGTIKDFTADQFTPTRWEDGEEKARFARRFIRFVESDFAEREFPLRFYRRLALTFGHIAHFNRHGFYDEFFSATESKVRFLRMTLGHPCCGDAAFTYSDVERALQSWLHQNGVLGRYERRLTAEQETAERAELARLQAKYAG
ncbi:MAG TPA: hypothetical protein VH592_26700 [Gemmataceae bacterium]|jgi:hypothetical protein